MRIKIFKVHLVNTNRSIIIYQISIICICCILPNLIHILAFNSDLPFDNHKVNRINF